MARGEQLRNLKGQFVSGRTGIEWRGLDLLDAAYVKFTENIEEYRRHTAEELGPAMEEYAKTNAPWQDRTGDARTGLHATVVHEEHLSSVYLGYDPDTPYGFYLENYTYNGVSYAIIGPTIQFFAPQMLARER